MKKFLVMGLILLGFNQTTQTGHRFSSSPVEDGFEAVFEEKTQWEMIQYYHENCIDKDNSNHSRLLKCAGEVHKHHPKFNPTNKKHLYKLMVTDMHKVIRKEPNYKHLFEIHLGHKLK
jgi:hypothetical protein